jgi:hypothetical protein
MTEKEFDDVAYNHYHLQAMIYKSLCNELMAIIKNNDIKLDEQTAKNIESNIRWAEKDLEKFNESRKELGYFETWI